MTFTTEVFRSSLSSGVTDTFQEVSFVQAGAVLAPSANGMQVSQSLNKIALIAGVSAHLENIQPQAASFQPLPYPTFNPNNVGTLFESPPKVWDFTRNPKVLRPTETFHVFASQISAGAETPTIFVVFTDGMMVPPPPVSMAPTLNGNGMFTIAHATATTTLTANAWTQVTPNLDTALPAGLYSLVGARAQSATALFFRVKPIQEPLWRPGGIGTQANDQLEIPGQRYINPLTGTISHWGEWLRFFQNQLPYVEFWATAADTKEDIWFDLIKISDITTSGAL